MPLIHFVDKELIDETDKRICETNKEIEGLEEHRFIANCLQIGFSINDLKEMNYKDVAKIMLCFIDTDKKMKPREATQTDIDRLLM